MHYLNESHILLFLIQVLILLGVARTLSVLCEKVKIPSIAGEIFAGILLGPTLFGRLSPEFHHLLFPNDPSQLIMLETMSWLGVFFLLLSSGFHVNVSQALKSGRAAALIGVIGVLVPIAIGFFVFKSFDPIYWGEKATANSFAIFLAVASSITAISVVARALADLKLNKSPISSLALSACAVNDIFGWFLFTIVISLIGSAALNTIGLLTTAIGIIVFVVLSITIGTKVLSIAINLVTATSLPQPAATQTLIISAGLLCGIITHSFGIHAILGFFLAGIMVGSANGISEEIRNSISDTFHAVFVPLFFATLGLHIDFLVGLELWPTIIFTLVAIVGKFVGAYIGAKLGGKSAQTSTLIGLIFIPGGAMEIVVATLALELQLIGQTIFVAIVFAALSSSIIAGSLIGYQVRKMGYKLT